MFCAASAGTAQAETVPRSRSSGKLFDVAAARADTTLGASYLEHRRTDRARVGHGLELRGGNALSWERRSLYVTSTSAVALRIFDRSSYSLSILQNGGNAGLLLGPVDLGAGFAVSLLNLDYLEGGFSFGMVSPRSLAVAGVRLGPVRVGAQAHVEYLWRWLGRDYFVRAVGVTLDIQSPSPRPPWTE